MLNHISINNYTIVDSLEMELSPGMTVITGETGAGKSIMLDALGLCLGDRADPKAVRPGCDRAEINASFDISHVPQARDWLAGRDLLSSNDCILRRVLTTEGRSRAYINGSPSTLQDCKELGELLIDIHSQHAHQSLLRKPVQRQLVDVYAGHLPLARTLEQSASDWLRCQRELTLLTGSRDEQTSRAQLLAYQVQELDELALADNELAKLEQKQKLLTNAEEILESAHQAMDLCDAQESGTRQALKLLNTETHSGAGTTSALELLDSAAIQLSEARLEIQAYVDTVTVNPARLAEVERRLELIYDIARKHRVLPEALGDLYRSVQEELQGLTDSSQRIEELQVELAALATAYAKDANKLTKQRRKAGNKLVKEAMVILSTLAMDQCRFEVALLTRDSDAPHPHGQEEVEFLISTNPGAAPQPLGKIASGGELSRISLAIQVVTASGGILPSMVFDEVDVGIGGAVAEVVGRLLRDLAAEAQILCVTHLAQVAAQGQQHLQVTKTSSKESAVTRMAHLNEKEKIEELARMLGGLKITEQSLAHAKEMLDNASI